MAYTKEQLTRMVFSTEASRILAAKGGCGLDVLVNDELPTVRRAVAMQGYGLDVLKDDPDWSVRAAVAAQGQYLDELAHDLHWNVRLEVSRHGVDVDYIDDSTGEYLASLVEASVYSLSRCMHWKPSETVRLPSGIDTLRDCLQFARSSDFSTLRQFGDSSFHKLIDTLQFYGVDCSYFRYREQTIEGFYTSKAVSMSKKCCASQGIDSSEVRKTFDEMLALGFEADIAVSALRKKYDCSVHVIRDALKAEGVSTSANSKFVSPRPHPDRERFLHDDRLCLLDISELGLSLSCYRKLRYANIYTIGDLLACSDEKLKGFYGFGERHTEALLLKLEEFCSTFQEMSEIRGNSVVAELLADANERYEKKQQGMGMEKDDFGLV